MKRTVQRIDRKVHGGDRGSGLAKDLEPGIKLGSLYVGALTTRLSAPTQSWYLTEICKKSCEL